MFHFTGYRVSFPNFPIARGFGKERWRITATRLPHSEISGSKRICRSPKLIAAYHVLHRLLAPRHPLCALKSLIPCLKSATRTCPPLAGIRRFPRFAGLATGHNRFRHCWRSRRFAVKIDVFGNQNIFKDHVRTARGISPAFQSFCSQSNHISLHMDVKERTLSQELEPLRSCGKTVCVENGGPDRTRTYDPRLIKAVL